MRILTVLIFFVALATNLPSQEVDRIEPPSWWVEMANHDVQIMLCGKNVGRLIPETNYPGVTIMNIQTGDSPNYLFVDLYLAHNTAPGDVEFMLSRNAKVVSRVTWSLNARRVGSAHREGVDQSDVIYLITPDRFANGDERNDSVRGMKEGANRSPNGARHGGDIRGVIQHIDYIYEMGYTTIWLNPVLENDMDRGSYHGYATTDYYTVDPRFGTNETWQELANECYERGLKQVMDMIPNHCGSNHWWMDDLPFKDWVNQWDTYTQSNHKKTVMNDPYAAPGDIKQFTDGWFVRTMPDLNQRNPFMATYLIQNAIWWVEYLQLAGIRIDTYPYSDPDFLTEYCRRLLEEYPDLFIVGEQWHLMPASVAYWQKGKINPDGYVSHLPQVMDFPLQSALVHALNTKGGWDDPWLQVYETLSQDMLYPSPMDLMIFPDNHDMSRIYTQLNENYDHYKLALAFFLTMRGIPQMFYGDEILMSHPGTDEHVIIRSDFPGGWDGDSVNAFTGEGLTDKQKNAQDFNRKLLNWRKDAEVIHHGKLMHFDPKDGVYVYFRYTDEAKVMVILNRHEEGPYTLELDRFSVMLSGHQQGIDVKSGGKVSLGKSITLEEVGPVIIELE